MNSIKRVRNLKVSDPFLVFSTFYRDHLHIARLFIFKANEVTDIYIYKL